MKNVFLALLSILTLGGIGGSIYLYMQWDGTKADLEMQQQKSAQLQQALDSIGPITTVYTVKGSVEGSSVIKDEDLMEISIPQAIVTENTIVNKEDILGDYYKVSIQMGTPLTKDVVMTEEYLDTMFEEDLVFDYLPLGLKTGDYVDVRVKFPYGETFIVLPKKRVRFVDAKNNIIKVLLNSTEQSLMTSAFTDDSLYGRSGFNLYCTKYIEPGIQAASIPFYPVREQMEPVDTLNPNITDKTLLINAELRDQMEIMLDNVDKTEASLLAGGNSAISSKINTAKEKYAPDVEGNGNLIVSENIEEEKASEGVGDMMGDAIPNIEAAEEQAIDAMEELSNINKTDAEGNQSQITESEEALAEGDPLFSEEEQVN